MVIDSTTVETFKQRYDQERQCGTSAQRQFLNWNDSNESIPSLLTCCHSITFMISAICMSVSRLLTVEGIHVVSIRDRIVIHVTYVTVMHCNVSSAGDWPIIIVGEGEAPICMLLAILKYRLPIAGYSIQLVSFRYLGNVYAAKHPCGELSRLRLI